MIPFFETEGGAHELNIKVDKQDRDIIQKAMILRNKYPLPDTWHDDANIQGMVIAEICRGYIDFMEFLDNLEKIS
jgi:hypothetical protein